MSHSHNFDTFIKLLLLGIATLVYISPPLLSFPFGSPVIVLAFIAVLLTEPFFLNELRFLMEPAVLTETLGLVLLLTVSLLDTKVGVLLMLLVLLTLFLLATESLLVMDCPSLLFFLGGLFGVSEFGVRFLADRSPELDPCSKIA